MIFIDTNIFVYSADRSCSEHKICVHYLHQRVQSVIPWYTSWNVIYEFLRITTHNKVFSKPLTLTQSWQFVKTLMEYKNFSILTPKESHSAIMNELVTLYPLLSGNILHDVSNVALMREHGIKTICTRDMDFHRFQFLDVENPLDDLKS